MANVKISDMTRATSVGGSDLLPIVQGGQSKSIEYKNMNKYSTSEQVVGTWIDGKPLYRKVITGTTPTVSSDGTEAISLVAVNNGETTSNDYYAVSGGWVRYHSDPYTMWSMPYYNNSMRVVKSLANISYDKLSLQVSSNGTVYNNCTFTCIVVYTKSTDSAS